MRFGIRFPTGTVAFPSALAACEATSARPAGTVLLNGKILTVDAKFSVREALAVRSERIIGVSWALPDAGYFEGEQQLKEKGADALRRIPAMNTDMKIGVHVGAGTDAHRVAAYNLFVSLQWIQDAKTVGSRALRGPEETPTREAALGIYTMASALFEFVEKERGSLEVGKFADMAVLSKDYMTVPVEEIGGIEAVMTMVGGGKWSLASRDR